MIGIPDAATLAERARLHGRDLEVSRAYWSSGQVAQRWNLSVHTVRGIDRSLLPYLEFGNGRLKRRRYKLEHIERYEKRHELGKREGAA